MNELHAPDLEELAAFIDGRLSGERKARVEARLLRDEDYYEIFLETTRFQQEHRQGTGARVVRWRSARIVLPVAAAALLALSLSQFFSRRQPTAEDWLAELDPTAVTARGESWTDPVWSLSRSTGLNGPAYRPEEVAFRLGARAIDLRVALAAGDRRATGDLARQLEQMATDADHVAAAVAYGQLQRQLSAGEFDSLQTQASQAEGLLRQAFADPLESARFALGAWAEAGRQAALSHNARALSSIVRRAPFAQPTPEIAPRVEILESLVADPVPHGFDAAARAFEDILNDLAGGAG